MVVGKILGNSGSEVFVKRGKETLVNRVRILVNRGKKTLVNSGRGLG